MTVRTTTSSCTATYFYEWSKAIDCASSAPLNEKQQHLHTHDDEQWRAHPHAHSHAHQNHNHALRRALLLALLILLGLAGLLAISCVVSGMHMGASAGGVGEGWLSGLVRRVVDDGPAGPNTESDFTKRKSRGVARMRITVLSLSSIRSNADGSGAFENLCYCPCYLCACCDSLARLPSPSAARRRTSAIDHKARTCCATSLLFPCSISLSFLDEHERALPPNYLSYSSAQDSRCVDRWRELYPTRRTRWRWMCAACMICACASSMVRPARHPRRVRHGGGCACVLLRRPGWARVLLRLASAPRGGVANAASSLRVCGKASERARTSFAGRVGGFCVDGGCVEVVPLLAGVFGATAYSTLSWVLRRVRVIGRVRGDLLSWGEHRYRCDVRVAAFCRRGGAIMCLLDVRARELQRRTRSWCCIVAGASCPQ
ncbi:hypothetical protein C8J57DRAFT_1668834 [Mycena rebaudengoi]|nr:hypothetical protein C8J57DRAFT_1668834 [Mycena rebaudengoi]